MNGTLYWEADYCFRIKRAKSEIVGYKGEQKMVRIPRELGGQAVTSIAKEAFAGNKTIRSVSFPQTMRHVGEGAFRACEALESVFINTELRVIGDYAFQACSSLKNIMIPRRTEVSKLAFSDCEDLKKFYLWTLGAFTHGRTTGILQRMETALRPDAEE